MSWRERCTPLLVEIADVAKACLCEDFGMEPAQADHAGYLIMRRIADAIGGASVYVPKADSIERHERDAAVWAEFRGNNVRELAQKYGITNVHVYRIIRRMREAERRAPEQPPSLDWAAGSSDGG